MLQFKPNRIKILAAVVMIIAVASLFHKPSPLPAFNPMDAMRQSAVKPAPVVRLHDKQGQFFCSGVVISNKYLLTAAHCLVGRARPKLLGGIDAVVRTVENKSSNAKIDKMRVNERADLGLLIGDFSMFNAQPIEVNPTRLIEIFAIEPSLQNLMQGVAGSTLAACGFPWGDELTCVAFRQRHIFYFQFQGSGFLFPGMSGGPVVEVETGRVVGVNHGVTEDTIVINPLIGLFTTLNIEVKAE